MQASYDLGPSRAYCEQLGLVWQGDGWVENAMIDARELAFNQYQFDAAMRHHLWQVKYLFTPTNYTLRQRFALAMHFLFGRSL